MSADDPKTKRDRLEQAIAHLESQRTTLGDAVVDAALVPLRQELAQLEKRPSAAASPGERRIVTILFSDVTGSTAIAEGLDPEEWTAIMNRIFERLTEPVERYGGTVARLMGDGILAFFGAPVAHEDDPERAILAGLEIIRGAHDFRRHLQEERGITFDVRVGVNTGLTVVGAVGSETAGEYTAMGDAVNLAARMEQTATPGTVRISEATYGLVADVFEVEALGLIDAKGKSALVNAYRVVGRRHDARRARGIAGLISPLVGRNRELEALRDIVAQIREGQGRIVSVIGEAGLGKSRLIAELRAEWMATQGDSDEPVAWREMTSTSYGGSRPYGTFQTQIQQSAGINSNDSAQSARLKLRQMLEKDPSQARLQRLYEVLLGLETEEEASLGGDAFRRELFATMLDSIREEIGGKPAALVFEDTHWTDAASLALEAHLLQLTRAYPVLMLFSFRPDLHAPIWQMRDQLASDYNDIYVEIRLHPLTDEDSDHMVDYLFADRALPKRLRRLLLERSDGNPFFIEEIVRALLDQGVLSVEDGGLRWQPGAQWGDVDIPTSLNALLAARIDRLAADIRRTLQLAAVIGRSFYYRVLEKISEAASELQSHLGTLQEVDLIREASRLPELEFMFRHALTQEAAYRTLLRQERRAFHAGVGLALEDLFPDRLEEMAPLLAMHFAEAGDKEKALRYYTSAGDSAFRLYANVEAVAHYTRALQFAREVGVDGTTITHLYGRRGRALDLESEHVAAIENYEAMIAEADQRGDERMALAGMNALATVVATVNPQFDRERALSLSERSLELSLRLGDRAASARAHWNMMLAYWYGLGDSETAVAHGEASLAIAREEQLREQMALTLSDLGLAYGGIGRWHQGVEAFEEARKIWRELDNQPMLANNLSNSAIPYFVLGQFEAALAAGNEARAISRAIENEWGQVSSVLLANYVYWEVGEPRGAIDNMDQVQATLGGTGRVDQPLAFGGGLIAWIYAALGAPVMGEPQFNRSIELASSMPGVMRPWHYAILTLRQLEIGDLDGASQFLGDSLKELKLDSAGSPAHITAFLARSRLALARNDLAEAIQGLDEMLRVFRAEGIRYFVADALYYRGVALIAMGKESLGRQTLMEARATAESLNARRILWQILAELANTEPEAMNAERNRRQAREIVRYIADHAGSETLRDAFLNSARVRPLLPDR